MLTKLRNLSLGLCPLCHQSSALGKFCLVCERSILLARRYPYRCPSCLATLHPHVVCPNCEEHRLILNKVYYAFDYVPPLDSLVLQFKNAQKTQLIKPFTQLFIQQLPPTIPPAQTPIIPIPSSTTSFIQRGYNPAVLFAKQLAKNLQYRLILTLLQRRHSLLAQKSLSRTDRFLHSSQLYYCAHRFDVERVILVDDIFTTGSTLDSAARALIAAGVKKVDAMVIARTANPL